MPIISETTVSIAIGLRLACVVLLILVIVEQIKQLQVPRLFWMKGLLLSLTAALLLTSVVPIWYYGYLLFIGEPTQAMNQALVNNNNLSVLIPAIILLVIYKQKGEK